MFGCSAAPLHVWPMFLATARLGFSSSQKSTLKCFCYFLAPVSIFWLTSPLWPSRAQQLLVTPWLMLASSCWPWPVFFSFCLINYPFIFFPQGCTAHRSNKRKQWYDPRDRHALNFVQDKFKRKNYFSNRLSKLKCNYNIMKVEQSICEGRTIQLWR